MTRKERLVLIEKFRKGQLEGIALQRFERMLEEDAQLSRELELDQEMSEALDDHSDYNLFQKLVREAEKQYFAPKPKRLWTPTRVAAAVVMVLAVGSGVWWLSSSLITPEERFTANFEPYPAPSNFRGDQLTQLDEDFMLGLVRYEDEQYAEAIEYFEKATGRDASNYTALFLTGVAYMAQKDFDKAEPIFKSMVNDDSHLFQDQCRWYLGLLYLSDEDVGNDDLAAMYFKAIQSEMLREQSMDLQ